MSRDNHRAITIPKELHTIGTICEWFQQLYVSVTEVIREALHEFFRQELGE
jgi:hypothetical protein